MKFRKARFWKHSNCIDVFFSVDTVQYDSGSKAKLKGTWCTQGVESWWPTIPDKLEIKEEYNNWNPYYPIEKDIV